jgi:hypothetical protein
LLFLDTESHQRMAARILNHQGLGDRAYFRSPAYFYLLAFLEFVGKGNLWFPRIFQSIVGSFCAVLAGLFAFKATGKRWAAALAGLIISCFWLSLFFDGELLIESSACFLNLAALYLLTGDEERAEKNGESILRIALSGLIMGMACIFRPNFLLVVIGVFVYWFLRKRHRQLAVLAVFTALPILPVTIRNIVAAKDPVLIASQDGINFWVGNGPVADGRTVILPYTRYQLDGEFLAKMKDDPWFREDVWLVSVYGAEKELKRPLKEGEVSRYWMETSFKYIAASPGRWLKLFIKKCYFLVAKTVVSNNRDLNYHRDHIPILSVLGKFHLGMILPFTLLGLLLGIRERKNFYLALYFFLYGLSVVLFFVTSRYTHPLFAALAIFVSVGLAKIADFIREKNWINLLAALVLFALFAWLSNAPIVKWNDRPLRASMRYNLGLAMMEKERYKDATEVLQAAVDIKPSYPEAQLALANALALSNRAEESI